MRAWCAIGLAGSLLLGGCGGGKLPEAEDQASTENPQSNQQAAPFARGNLGSTDAPTDDHAIALKLEGLSSAAELKTALQGVDNSEVRELFEVGFRKTFAANSAQRNYGEAAAALEKVLTLKPGFAEAHRALGYARFNMGFDVDSAMHHYKKSVELKPDYGEAHYALAFMYAMGDKAAGATHFEQAMKLGVADERDLGQRFYGQ